MPRLLNGAHSTLKCACVDSLLVPSCVDNWKVLHIVLLVPLRSCCHLPTDFIPICATVDKLALNTSNIKLPTLKNKRCQVLHPDFTSSFGDNNPSLPKQFNYGFNVAEIVNFTDEA